MATTAVIVEILVGGFFATLWIALLAAVVLWPGQRPAVDLTGYMDWASIALFGYSAICYQLGWIVNWITYEMFRYRFIPRVRREAFAGDVDDTEYERRRAAVHQSASDALLSELRIDLSVVRLSRSGFLNYSMLFVVGSFALILRSESWRLSALVWVALAVPLVGAMICWHQAKARYRQYYRRMASAELALSRSKAEPSATTQVGRPSSAVDAVEVNPTSEPQPAAIAG